MAVRKFSREGEMKRKAAREVGVLRKARAAYQQTEVALPANNDRQCFPIPTGSGAYRCIKNAICYHHGMCQECPLR